MHVYQCNQCGKREKLVASLSEEKAASLMRRYNWEVHLGYAVCPEHKRRTPAEAIRYARAVVDGRVGVPYRAMVDGSNGGAVDVTNDLEG